MWWGRRGISRYKINVKSGGKQAEEGGWDVGRVEKVEKVERREMRPM